MRLKSWRVNLDSLEPDVTAPHAENLKFSPRSQGEPRQNYDPSRRVQTEACAGNMKEQDEGRGGTRGAQRRIEAEFQLFHTGLSSSRELAKVISQRLIPKHFFSL